MPMTINCDMGELAEGEEAIMPHIDWANVACGGHAGDEQTMRRTVDLARRYGVRVGAHPGYPDRANFGRTEMPLTPEQIADAVEQQVRALAAISEIYHVKPHGALYNVAVRNEAIAEAIALGVGRVGSFLLVGLAGSRMLDVWRGMGFPVAAEAFADRRYEPDGKLRPRRFADALIADPAEAAEQAARFAAEGRADTICIHGDSPGAAEIVRAVAQRIRMN